MPVAAPARCTGMRTRLAALSVVLLPVLLPALTAAPVAHAKQGETAEPLEYVAMGDSYSAASGVLPADPTAPPWCARSLRNYPNVIAESVAVDLRDVTCGAAQTRDYREEQYRGVAPQYDALTASTDLVTMTIGGNDGDVFFESIAECGRLGLMSAGQGSPCQDEYGDSFADTVRDETYPALVEALEGTIARAPGADVAILGYPWILPATEGCFDKMPVARGDVPYLRDLQAVLNDAVRRAAAATGATYVDLAVASDGHDACQPIGTRWVEPVVQGTNPVVVHPNELGEREMAAQAIVQLGLG